MYLILFFSGLALGLLLGWGLHDMRRYPYGRWIIMLMLSATLMGCTPAVRHNWALLATGVTLGVLSQAPPMITTCTTMTHRNSVRTVCQTY